MTKLGKPYTSSIISTIPTFPNYKMDVEELKCIQHFWKRMKWGHLNPPMYHYLILYNTAWLPMYFLQSLGVLQLVIVVKDMNLRAVNPDDHLLCHLLGNSLSSNFHLYKDSMWYLFHWIVKMRDMHMMFSICNQYLVSEWKL